ncbi:MAG: CDP-alcohol phosphatidyltransferase family protein [Acidimicrobiia bacterium]
MLDHRLRGRAEQVMRPVGARLRAAGFTADQITLLGLAASAFTGAAIASGHLFLAMCGLFVSGCTDVLDGAVAKAGGTSGNRGAFFDSVADRVSDALVLGGATWYLAGRDPHLTLLPFAVASLALIVSYERAKAEALGLKGNGGLMERAERMFVLGFGLMFSALVPALWILLVTSSITVVQRFVKVWRQASPAREGDEASRAWWISSWPAGLSESRAARWGVAARPPGERARPVRWLVSSRPPPADPEPSRLARWWADSANSPAGVRSQLRKLRGRTRP